MKKTPEITPLEDLRQSALSDYEEASTKVYHFNSDIPKAINFYFDNLLYEQNKKKEIPLKLLQEIGMLGTKVKEDAMSFQFHESKLIALSVVNFLIKHPTLLETLRDSLKGLEM